MHSTFSGKSVHVPIPIIPVSRQTTYVYYTIEKMKKKNRLKFSTGSNVYSLLSTNTYCTICLCKKQSYIIYNIEIKGLVVKNYNYTIETH